MGSYMNEIVPVFSAFLLFLMPLGAALVESALVRAKHSVNPAAKMMAQAVFGVVAFWAIGLAFAVGPAGNGMIGFGGFLASFDQFPAGNALFLTTTALAILALVTGAGAERMSFLGAVVLSIALTAFVIPIVMHWTWTPQGLLAMFGFVDQAGGGTVFVTAGAAALGLSLALGPRLGKRSGGPRFAVVQSQIFPFLILGVGLLWIGGLGLAIGRNPNPAMAASAFKLLLSGAIGGSLALIAHLVRPALFPLTSVLHGVLGGMAAVLAAFLSLDNDSCALFSLIGAASALCGMIVLSETGIDDGTAFVPATLGGGLTGVIGVAFLPSSTGLPIEQSLTLQLTGAALIAGFALVSVYGLVTLTAPVLRWRVTPEVERRGLSVGEHGMTTDVAVLINQMSAATRNQGVWTHIDADSDSEFVQVAREFNATVDTFRAQVSELKSDLRRSEDRSTTADNRSIQLSLSLSEKDQKLDETAREVSLLADQLSRALIALEGVYKVRDGLVNLTQRAFARPIEELRRLSSKAANSRDPSDIEELILGAQTQSAQLARSLDDLLSYADAVAGAPPNDEQVVDLGKLLGDVRERFLGLVQRKNITFKAIWEPPYDQMRGNPAALRKILLNLMNGSVHAAIRPHRDGDFAIEVTDSAPPMAPGDIAAALDPLAMPAKSDNISLALCKTLAEQHGGHIAVRSRPEGGNRISVLFPRSRLAPAAQAR